MATPRRLTDKIKSPAALARLLHAREKRGGRAVFTNGCFDIVHKGHVTYLERARRLGDLLVVALNSDAAVRRLKGKSRPINALADRLEVMAALESVDFVTWFGEDDPLQLICRLRPQILVKGGDWKVKDIIGGREVVAWGGRVKSLAYVPGRSTTQIIARATRKSGK
jgi:rfaE bifunctional protein nucleotidyltransferase chain/domain